MVKKYSIEAIAVALDLTEGNDGNWTGSCPCLGHEDRNPSYSVKVDPDTGKLLTKCFVCTDQASVHLATLEAIEKYFEIYGGDPSEIDNPADAEASSRSKQDFARAMWDQADIDAPMVALYLKGRGLSGDVPPNIRQAMLEYIPKSGVFYPVMLAAVMDCQNTVMAVHRTFLQVNADGSVSKASVDAPKKALGLVKGNAVHVSDLWDGMETLNLSEGLETGLALEEGLKSGVVWSVLSAQNLPSVVIPASIKSLYFWADLDRSSTGEEWARTAAAHFAKKGLTVYVVVPQAQIPTGQNSFDWLDAGSAAIVDAYENALEFVSNEPWDQANMPPTYSISRQGVFVEKTKGDGTKIQVPVATGPLWITGRKIDLATRETELEISWFDTNESSVMRRWISRGQLLKRAPLLDMVELAGFPVYDGIAGETVKYLANFEQKNQLPTTLIARKPGWSRNTSEDWIYITGQDDTDILFHPELAYRSYAAALNSKGRFTNWLAAVRPIALKYPLVLFALLAVLAAPLLRILDAQNFVIDFWGRTSVGKTTILLILASAWGKPSRAGGLILSWNNTAIFAERLAAFYGGGIPIFFDDSQTANDKTLESIIYMIANGVGRGRAKPYSVKKTDFFQVVMFATGEKPLTERSFPGAKARVIEIHGSPFPGIDPNLLHDLKSAIMNNYGFLGVLFITALLQRDEQALRDAYTDYIQQYAELAVTEIGNRFASYFAVIRLVGDILVDIPQMEWVTPMIEETLLAVWNQTTVDMEETDMAQKALLGIAAWIESNRTHFATQKSKAIFSPTYGIIKDNDGFVAIIPQELANALKAMEVQSLAAVLAEFMKRGWLIYTPGRKQKQVKIDSNPVWCICIPLNILFPKMEEGEVGSSLPLTNESLPSGEPASQALIPYKPLVMSKDKEPLNTVLQDLFGKQPQDIIRYKKGVLDSINRKNGRITILNDETGLNSWTSSMSASLKSKIDGVDDNALNQLSDRAVHYKLGTGGDIEDFVIIQ